MRWERVDVRKGGGCGRGREGELGGVGTKRDKVEEWVEVDCGCGYLIWPVPPSGFT
jgi:hypothetical protein